MRSLFIFFLALALAGAGMPDNLLFKSQIQSLENEIKKSKSSSDKLIIAIQMKRLSVDYYDSLISVYSSKSQESTKPSLSSQIQNVY